MGLLFNKYIIAAVICGVLFISGLVYIKYLKNEIDSLTKDNTVLTVKLEVSQQSVKDLENAINEQNLEIEKWKNTAIEKERAGRIAIEKARLEAEKKKKEADDIISRPLPPGKTACEAANDLISGEIKNGK